MVLKSTTEAAYVNARLQLFTAQMYPFVPALSYLPEFYQTRLTVFHSCVGTTFATSIADSVLSKGNSEWLDALDVAMSDMARLVWSQVLMEWGVYPAARLWMAEHLVYNLKNTVIPGWMWQRFKEAHPGKKATKNPEEYGFWGVVDQGIAPRNAGALAIDPSVGEQVFNDLVEKGRQASRRVKIEEEIDNVPAKARTVKPTVRGVKKPECPAHGEMVFNPARNLWECADTGCKVIARPKQEQEDGKVTLGKGEVDIRIAYIEGQDEPQIILVTDDNLAIDITPIAKIGKSSRLVIDKSIKTAKYDGETAVRVEDDVRILITAPAALLGLDNA